MIIETRDNLTVCAPDSLRCLTSYVLLEQEQWLDPEMDLVRGYVKPGMTAVDIGAGFGAYSLILSKLTGNDGKIFAFEADSESSEYLRQSKAHNNLKNLDIIPAGVSDGTGVGWLRRSGSPELGHIGVVQKNGDNSVSLVQLDKWWEDAGRPDIHLLKIDVNGHEPMVLQGARELLTRTSPLILLAVNSPNPALSGVYSKTSVLSLKILQAMGYRFYSYLPGPGMMVPFDSSQNIDPSRLNLVACKPDLTKKLERSNLVPGNDSGYSAIPNDYWQQYISSLEFSKPLMAHWKNTGKVNEYLKALNLLCATQDKRTYTPAARLLQLNKSARIFNALYNKGPSSGSLCFSFARACFELGYTKEAAEILKCLDNSIAAGNSIGFDLPFISPVQGFDSLRIKTTPQNWIMARCQESILYLENFSSYFMDEKALFQLQSVHQNPEHGEQTHRSLSLAVIAHRNSSQYLENCKAGTNNYKTNKWFWEDAIFDPKMLFQNDHNYSDDFLSRIFPKDLEKSQIRQTVRKLNYIQSCFPELDMEKITAVIESIICPSRSKVSTTYSIHEGGIINIGFLNHTVHTDEGTQAFITKIITDNKLFSELIAYQEVFNQYPEVKKYTPEFICHTQSKCGNVHFITMKKIRGDFATKDDIKQILDFYKSVNRIDYSKTADFPGILRPNIEYHECSPKHIVLTTLFSHIHKLDSNRKIFFLIYDSCKRNKLSGNIINILKRLENIIIQEKAYEYPQPDELYTLAHGDFRRENILIDKSSRLFIIDWSHATIAPAGYDLALLFSSLNLTFNEIDDVFFSNEEHGSRLSSLQKVFFLYALISFWVIFLNGDPNTHRHLAGENYEADLLQAVYLAEKYFALAISGDKRDELAKKNNKSSEVLINKVGFFIFDPRQFDYYQNIYKHMEYETFELILNNLRDKSSHLSMLKYVRDTGLPYTTAGDILTKKKLYKIIVGTGIFPLKISNGQDSTIDILPEPLLGITSIRFPRGMDIPANHPANPLRRKSFNFSFCHGKIDKALIEKNTSRPAYIIGDPRYDNFPEYPDSKRFEYYREFGLDKDKELVIWLSTRVDWQTSPDANITLWLDEFLKLRPHYNLVLRPHPHRVRDNPKLMEKIKNTGLSLDLVAEREMNQIFKAADYIICDYGSSIFSSIYLDRNLLLFNHPEQDRTTKFLELKVRNNIVNLNPADKNSDKGRLIEILQNQSVWKDQEHIRKQWRETIFGGIMPGQGARKAATVLEELLYQEGNQT